MPIPIDSVPRSSLRRFSAPTLMGHRSTDDSHPCLRSRVSRRRTDGSARARIACCTAAFASRACAAPPGCDASASRRASRAAPAAATPPASRDPDMAFRVPWAVRARSTRLASVSCHVTQRTETSASRVGCSGGSLLVLRRSGGAAVGSASAAPIFASSSARSFHVSPLWVFMCCHWIVCPRSAHAANARRAAATRILFVFGRHTPCAMLAAYCESKRILTVLWWVVIAHRRPCTTAGQLARVVRAYFRPAPVGMGRISVITGPWPRARHPGRAPRS
mmetsp:Transcript_66448/g.198472  ORF Transcript_66448/g.198472 Transcript_66448/m.198472 type:complete len:277 (+) Transcript_66448:240-1070(+)